MFISTSPCLSCVGFTKLDLEQPISAAMQRLPQAVSEVVESWMSTASYVNLACCYTWKLCSCARESSSSPGLAKVPVSGFRLGPVTLSWKPTKPRPQPCACRGSRPLQRKYLLTSWRVR